MELAYIKQNYHNVFFSFKYNYLLLRFCWIIISIFFLYQFFFIKNKNSCLVNDFGFFCFLKIKVLSIFTKASFFLLPIFLHNLFEKIPYLEKYTIINYSYKTH